MSLARTSLSEILHSSVNSSQRSRRLFPDDTDPATLTVSLPYKAGTDSL